MSLVTLRPYQESAVEKVRFAIRQGAKRILVVVPTGGGKTVIFSFIAVGAAGQRKRVLILAHRKELVRQASEKLTAAGLTAHGIIAPGYPATNDLVQVASVQTLGRRLDNPLYTGFDIIVIDEAHHAVAGQWKDILDANPQAIVIGVTATPERADGKGLGASAGGCFDVMVEGPTVEDLTAKGFLCPAVIFAPSRGGPDLSGVRTHLGDYEKGALADAMDRPSITGDVVAHYRKLAAGKAAVAFCASVRHAEKVAEAFRADGWRAVAASGATPAAERDAAIGGLADGRVQILCTCDLISEGLDVPLIEAVILVRPTQSLGLHLQQVGRGLRPAPGKSHLIVLDHAGNTLRHGMPESERTWSLQGRKKRKGKEGAVPVKQCPSCFAIHAPAPKCPQCTHVYETVAREVEEVAGELQQMTPELIAHLKTAPLRDVLRKGMSRNEVERIRQLRGYKKGWTWHRMQELTGAG